MNGDAHFRAVITPSRSLSRDAAMIIIGLLLAFVLASGVVFISQGAWPIVGFLGLDVALLAAALWLNKASGKAFEEVVVTPKLLRVRNVDYRGKESILEFNPAWCKIEKDVDDDFGTTDLFVVSHGKRHQIAVFLSPPEKNDFYDALNGAIARNKVA